MTAIAVINESHLISDAEVQAMLPAFETQWNRDLRSVWPLQAVRFSFVPKGQNPPPSDWWLVFLDNSDQAGALAYHDLTSAGWPLSKVFVETIQQAGDSVSVAATHEVCEMAVDPWLAMSFQDSQGVFWAAEVCDPCEDDSFAYTIGSVLVTDFITPDWFTPGVEASTFFDFKGHVRRPFEVLPGGYAQYFDPSQGWVQVEGGAMRAYAQRMSKRNSRHATKRSSPRRSKV